MRGLGGVLFRRFAHVDPVRTRLTNNDLPPGSGPSHQQLQYPRVVAALRRPSLARRWRSSDLSPSTQTHFTTSLQPPVHRMPEMRHIDANLISTDLQARVDYLAKFIEFGPADVEALHNAAPIVKPLAGAAVDAVCERKLDEKLFSFDITRVTFMARNTGFTGKLSEKLEDINHESEQIKFRKDFLKVWVVKVFTADYNDPKVSSGRFMMGLGIARRKIPYSLILLGYVQSMLTSAVMGRDDLPQGVKTATLLAINKVMWIQNDLFARHYIPSYASKKSPKTLGVDERVWPVVCGGLATALAFLAWNKS
ncbi:hypothetical protein AG1IA_04863 [Rhizoctonia solani AG-1 IA]|uniref:Globin-sensor domain-containing protein n=1 Tax=Thanatephorus cucumeris (strain AG1-IA) TaxID=983506 RepID=L8WSZ1_THACA|nr:hypothetical protein AG1IA_04863 [Rhizoctonia solani AG-1 IA]